MVDPLLNAPIVQNPDGKCRDYRCENVLMPSLGFGHAFIGFDLCSHTMDRPLFTTQANPTVVRQIATLKSVQNYVFFAHF